MRSLTLVRKNLFRKKLRFALLFVSIMVAFFLYGALMSIKDIASTGGDSVRPDRLITINKINFTQPLPISYLNRIRAIDGVKLASHAGWFGAYYQEPKNFIVAFYVDPESYLQVYSEILLTPEERQSFIKDRTGMIVGKDIATKYGWKVGQKVPIFSNIYSQNNGARSWDFTVSGIFSTNKKNAPANYILMGYEYFNETRAFARDTTGQVVLVTADAARNADIKAKIDSGFANSAYATDTVTEQQFSAAFVAQFGNISFIISLVVGVSFITILIIVGNTLVMAVRERTREIGVLKTLGFSARRILSLIVGESLLVALLGGLAGLLLANVVIAGMAASGMLAGISMNPNVWATGLLWMLLLGLLTALIPTYNALRLNIVTALGRR